VKDRLGIQERLALIPSKLRSKGWGWFFGRLLDEGVSPYRGLKLCLVWARRALARRLIFAELRTAGNRTSNHTLFAVYDLDVYPISYDILWFLLWAELKRQKQGFEKLQCVFVPISDQSKREFPPGYDAVVDHISREWRFRNICLPAVELIAASGGPLVCGSRKQLEAVQLFIKHRIPWRRTFEPAPALATIYRETSNELAELTGRWGLRASSQGIRYVRSWLDRIARGRRPVVITLRQYAVDPQRNSNIDDWARFARGLDPTRYCAIIVPDTDRSFESQGQFEGLPIFREASWNLGLRMALYELAFMNMFVNCGPGSLCILNSVCPYLFFKISVDGVELASANTLQLMGFVVGETPKFATRFQRWIWEDDRLEVLKREFAAMASTIEESELVSTAQGVQLEYGTR
jgi:hypothetical protein